MGFRIQSNELDLAESDVWLERLSAAGIEMSCTGAGNDGGSGGGDGGGGDGGGSDGGGDKSTPDSGIL